MNHRDTEGTEEEKGIVPLPSHLNALTQQVIGAAIEVHRVLGPGFLEVVYEEALAVEFIKRGMAFERQVPISVSYKGHEVGQSRLDFIVAEALVIELKAIDGFAPIHKAQALSYLKATGYRLALLINFNEITLKDGVRRVAL